MQDQRKKPHPHGAVVPKFKKKKPEPKEKPFERGERVRIDCQEKWGNAPKGGIANVVQCKLRQSDADGGRKVRTSLI